MYTDTQHYTFGRSNRIAIGLLVATIGMVLVLGQPVAQAGALVQTQAEPIVTQIAGAPYSTPADGARSATAEADPSLLYANFQVLYLLLRVPDSLSGPIWLADDMLLITDPALVTRYAYLTYGLEGAAPYHVDSALFRFNSCTCAPVPLIDWNTGDCCEFPAPIPGTEGSADIDVNDLVWVTVPLPAPVTVDQYIWMLLEYSGANVADNAGWIIAGSCDDDDPVNGPDVGYTENFWAEDVFSIGCGLYYFGDPPDDPWAGFAAAIWAPLEGDLDNDNDVDLDDFRIFQGAFTGPK